ncbi:MarR family winged helix-turn-helix transcriptional regulator [Devosia sp. ZW T5_3]|uniref:MarR family winged helix-turn-helix transcriptional regulator n=1 Tax=Devosia sp. ZW T5_3 TaxID=3378085 RepID=UPI003853FDC3
MSTKRVQNAHISTHLPKLMRAFIDITAVMNGPERDEAMLKATGLSMERALCPILVLVGQLGPIGIVELAGKIGRDYSTVSRQVARLEELGLLSRQVSPADKRIREAIVTSRGNAATQAIDAARLEVAEQLFGDWTTTEFEDLVRLTGKLASNLIKAHPNDPSRKGALS